MPWKIENGQVVLQDGNPVWVYQDGKEAPADFESALAKIGVLNTESASRRRKIDELETKLRVLDGVEKPEEYLSEARKALETVKNLKDKQLIDAGEAEKVKSEAVKAMQMKLDEAAKKQTDAEQALHREMIGGRFARSKFIGEKLAIPPDLAESAFGRNFRIENGAVVALDASGNQIFSRQKPGELADFDEALGFLVDAYPHRDQILKASGGAGGGSHGSDRTPGLAGTIADGDDSAFLANLDKIAKGEVKVE